MLTQDRLKEVLDCDPEIGEVLLANTTRFAI
jgi:hypothetical protein